MSTVKIEKEFENTLRELTDAEFWGYVKHEQCLENFEQMILDCMDEWDIETKKEAIEEFTKIIARRQKNNENEQ